MNLTFLDLVLLFSLQFVTCLFILAAFVIGAFVVYRTKREPHDSFIGSVREQAGDAGQVEDIYGPEMRGPNYIDDEYLPPDGGNVDHILYGTQERQSQFMKDLQKDLQNKGSE